MSDHPDTSAVPAAPLLRSLLYAPANRPDLVAKMPRSSPDAAVIDLEDGTPPESKVIARSMAVEAARSLCPQFGGTVWLRVNAPASDLLKDDLECLASGAFHGVVVPKVESADQVAEIERRLEASGRSLSVIWGLETVAGVHRADEILSESRLGVAAYFGAEDYIADLGGRRTRESRETLYARSRVAIACRLAGLVAIDQVVLSLNDDELFLADVAGGVDLGYRGKNCIHPAQVALCARGYAPSAQAIARAERLLECYEAAVRDGKGTANFEGQMIDTPLVVQARSVLAIQASA